jgi:LmbE family N-acetylglucosaminyl deacetylase
MALETEPLPEGAPHVHPSPEPGGPVLAVFAHPDDAEISAGGTLSRWCDEGRSVHLLVLTNGDRGADKPVDRAELAATRLVETRAAGEFIGLAGVRVLDTHDGELENTPDVRREIVREVRRLRPTVVLSCDPTAVFFGNRYYNHSDHRNAGACALDAVFPAAGNPLFFEELLDEGLEPWSVTSIWLGWTMEPNHHQDITGFLQRKVDALGKHESQVADGQIGFFEEWLPLEAVEAGKRIGVEHAESFRVLELG